MKSSANRIAWALAVAGAWIWTWFHLSIVWSLNPQYEYGFGIPPLFLYMVWTRCRGPLAPPRDNFVFRALVILAWLALFFGEFLRWHDPLWRMTGGLLALGSTLLTAALFWREGGAPLLRRQLFPLFFCWLALPWPTPLETATTQFLLGMVTGATVNLANLFGIAALQHGNVVELRTAVVGMEDACSGIQSFQTTFMVSLFLGEFFRLPVSRRVYLLFGGWVVCLLANLSRIMGLIFAASWWGQKGMENAHDTIGSAATIFNFLALYGLARLLCPRDESADNSPVVLPPDRPSREGLFVLSAVVAIPLMAASWFLFVVKHPVHRVRQAPEWILDTTHLPAGWRGRLVREPQGLRPVLRFSEWHAVDVDHPRGWTARVIDLFWKPNVSAPKAEFPHTPNICMLATGWDQDGDAWTLTLKIRGRPQSFIAYRFTQEGLNPMIVLQTVDDGDTSGLTFSEGDSVARMDRFWALWRAPLRRVSEEMLIYMPAMPEREFEGAAQEVLDLVLRKKGAKETKEPGPKPQ